MNTTELAGASGCTEREIQWWLERGLLVASRRERGFLCWELEEAAVARVIRGLRGKGCSLQRISACGVAGKLRDRLERSEIRKPLYVAVSAGTGKVLVGNGAAIWEEIRKWDGALWVVEVKA